MATKTRKRRRLPKRKTTRANKKLMTIIGFTVAVLVIGLGAAWFFLEFRGAQRNIQIGDELVAEGNYKFAIKQYGRAIDKEATNLEYVKKMRDTLSLITPATPSEADSFYRQYVSTLQHEARYDPLDIDKQLRVVEEMFHAAHITGEKLYWRLLEVSSNMGLDRILPDDPRRHELVLYRALATLHIKDLSMTDTIGDDGNIRFPGEHDIEDVLESDPGNEIAWAALAHGRMAVYHRLLRDGRLHQAESNRAFADETMQTALEIAGGGLEVAETYLREMLLRRTAILKRYVVDPTSVSQEEQDVINAAILDTRERAVAAFDPAMHHYRTAEFVLLLMQTGSGSIELSTDILREHVEAYPDDSGLLFMLAQLLQEQRLFDEAVLVAQLILDTPQSQVGLFAIRQFKIRPIAAQLLVQLAVKQSENSEADERIAFIDEAKRQREVLADLVSQDTDSLYLLYADGLIAMAEKRYVDAASQFEELIRRKPDVHPRVYRETAIVLAQSGARGLALERLAVALEGQKGDLSNYLLKARLELMGSDFESASKTLNRLSADARDRKEVKELLDLISMKRGGTRFTDPILALIAMSERATSLGEFEDAITLLKTGIEKTNPPDWRLYAAMSNVYLALQDMDEAVIWMRRAVEAEPDSQILRNTLTILENEDVVVATIAIVEAMGLDEAEKAETIAVRLFRIGMRKLAESERWVGMGGTEQAAESKSISERALAASVKYQVEAEVAGADMTEITLIRFNLSLVNQDMDKANELLEKLTNLTDDHLEIDGAKVRLFLAMAKGAKDKGDQLGFDLHANKAIDLAKNMTTEVPFSAFAWRMLGTAYSTMQQHLEALSAFAEAYRIAPNEINNIRKYVALLARTRAEPQRHLRVVRTAKKQFPKDKQLLERWLVVEMTHGEKWKVIEHHNEQYKLHPDDKTNALLLARLLVNTNPAREFIRNADGSEVFTTRKWNQLQSAKRDEAIQKVQDEWDVMIEEIVENAEKEEDSNLRIAYLHAGVVRDRGQLDAASEIWDRYIEACKGTDSYIAAVTKAAEFLRNADRIQQAISILRSAKEQEKDRFEIDAALGNVLYLVKSYEEAAEYLNVAVDATGNQILHSRWVESLIFSGQFDKAESALANFKSNNTKFGRAMLRALISNEKSIQLQAQGDITGCTAELTRYRNFLQEAIGANPKSPVPYIRLAKSLLNEYQLTQDKSLLEEALQVADNGEKYVQNSVDFAVIRADVLQNHGQLNRAVEYLTRFITQHPEEANVRRWLIDAYLDMDDADKAISMAKGGIDVDPTDIFWYKLLGDLHLRANNDRGKAVRVYMTALKRNPSSRLMVLIDETTRTTQVIPNRELLSLVQGSLSKLHPISGSIEAKVLMNLGRKRDSLLAMEKSWNAFEFAIKSRWIPPSDSRSWFYDLREMFDEDPEAGEQMIYRLAGSTLSEHQLVGLATYWGAFGDEYVDRAVRIIENAIEKSVPGSNIHVQQLTLLASYLVNAGRFEESEKIFRQLVDEHESPIILNNLAYVVGVYLNKPEEGLLLVRQAVKKMPRNPFFIDTIASLYERSGDRQKAAEALEFLLQIDPANATAMARLAVLYAEFLGQPDRGVVFAEKARSQTPRSPQVLDALGWSYYQSGRTSVGEDFLLKSLKRGGTMSTYIHLAQLVMSRSEFNKALGHLRMAQELAQDDYSLNRIKALQDDIRKAKLLADK